VTISPAAHLGDVGASPRRPDGFFEAQRQERIRSRVLIGAIFLLLWLLANWPFWLAYRERTCAASSCR
jgi:hypothetical protein